jgi:hypothetical protein
MRCHGTTGGTARSKRVRPARSWRRVARGGGAQLGRCGGALLTDGVAPTGNAGVDAAERAALVALGALAGSRARRWPLFVVAALASTLAEGVGLALGLGAVAASTVVLAVDRRNRAVGAAAGAAVTLCLMQLRPVGPLGFTALIGTVLFVSMCVSAYQRIGRVGTPPDPPGGDRGGSRDRGRTDRRRGRVDRPGEPGRVGGGQHPAGRRRSARWRDRRRPPSC